MDIQKQAHQLRDGNGRVGIVEMDGHLFREVHPGVLASFAEAPEDVLESGSHKKILLFEPQFPAGGLSSDGYKQLGDGFGLDLAHHGPDVIAPVEIPQFQFPGRFGFPQSHIDDMIVPVSGNQDIAGIGHHHVSVSTHSSAVSAPGHRKRNAPCRKTETG
jgi:hypothetical protein